MTPPFGIYEDAEVLVHGDEDAAFAFGEVQDLSVAWVRSERGTLKDTLKDIVSVGTQEVADVPRHAGVDEEPHPAPT
ncbi:MAG: hypothetical protein WD673_04140 [Alphaproteobacteria bacterium]